MNTEYMITPEEALELCGRLRYSEVDQALNIAKAYQANACEIWGDILLYAILYHAGRIDGIRSERARRRRKVVLTSESEPGATLEAHREKIVLLLPLIKSPARLKRIYDFAHALWIRQAREKASTP